jgi:2'-5' RNA ligase
MVVGHITLTFAPDASEDDAEDITQNFACQIMSHPFVQNVKAETGKFEKPEPIPGQMVVEDLLAS